MVLSDMDNVTSQAGTLPHDHNRLQSLLEHLYTSGVANSAGEISNYLPELAQANPAWFGLCAMTLDGTLLEAGDSRVPFTLQSIAKPLLLALAIEDHGAETILNKIGIEPTGERFDSILYANDKKDYKLNPFMNAGAIATLDLIVGDTVEEKFFRVRNLLRSLLGKDSIVDQRILVSRRKTDHQNTAIAHLLLSQQRIRGSAPELLDLYHRICSITVDNRDLATIAGVLSNGGIHPCSGERILPA